MGQINPMTPCDNMGMDCENRLSIHPNPSNLKLEIKFAKIKAGKRVCIY